MSRKGRATQSAVERLVEQRRLIQDWLVKLKGNVDGMPAHVIERVRNDYRTRLDAVMAELAGHRDALREALEEAQGRHEDLEQVQQQKKDELTELRLRRTVGEMEEEDFKDQGASLQGAIDQIKKDISATIRDIDRYEEIIDVIATGEAGAAEPAKGGDEEGEQAQAPEATRPAAESGEPRDARERRAREEAPAPAPPRTEPALPEEQRPAAAQPSMVGGDELAFLRSVSSAADAAKNAPAAAASSPPAAPPAKAEGPPAARKEPPPQAAAPITFDAAPGLIELPDAQPSPPRRPAPPPVAGRTDPSLGQASLKCKECGAMNRPTEWYCEKCGAELAAF